MEHGLADQRRSSDETGLSDAEAASRRARGEGNDHEVGSSRSYLDIVRANLFTFFNNLLFVIGVALIALGHVNDAMTSVGLGLVNALISTAQEARAKRQLDRIGLLNRPTVTIIRSGVERSADPKEIVLGDVIRLAAGDQMMVDGVMIGGGSAEIDEALLTGESTPILKREGDRVLSGSFCVSGDGLCRADKVGRDSYANRLLENARAFRLTRTPLQRQIDLCVRAIMIVVALMSGLILLAAVLEKASTLHIVQLAAVLSGQVPYGLFFVIVVAYALAAAAIAKQGALVQQINAVESLCDVDIICTDKTGTLTTNRLVVETLIPAEGVGDARFAALLARFAASVGDVNPTIAAIREAGAAERGNVDAEIGFSSARKWSALSFGGGDDPGTFVLGAPDILDAHLADPVEPHLTEALERLTARGVRVLLFACAEAPFEQGTDGSPRLPRLRPLGLVALIDQLRPQAKETLAAFARLGIRLKIISGDDPRTVAALARQASLEFGSDTPLVSISGADLAALSPEAFDAAAESATVFGRIAPAQKEKLVDALVRRGHYVAMVGDGVNDVLALKRAQLGIAVQSGSGAARNVADIVLIEDSFAALVPAFHEGRRIIAGMAVAMELFFARIVTSILMIIAITMLGLSFPFEPAQVATSLFTVGIPTLLLGFWAKPAPPAHDLLARLVRFVVPPAIITMVIGVAIYTFEYNSVLDTISSVTIPDRVIRMFEHVTGVRYKEGDVFTAAAATIVAQTALSVFIAYTAFVLLLFVEPPIRFFAAWTPVSHDRRPAWLALALSLIFAAIVQIGPVAAYFALIPLRPLTWLMIAAALAVWTITLHAAWRFHWLERFFGLDGAWRQPTAVSPSSPS